MDYKRVFALMLSVALAGPVWAQELDVDALVAKIDSRSGQYDQLTEILQGSDPNRALAAFDVMLETGDKSLREAALSSAMAATDERLRARALWEVLQQKDSFTVNILTEDLGEEETAALASWVGEVSNWKITERYPETQCLNLYKNTKECHEHMHLSVSGLKVEMSADQTLSGSFSLTPEGVLRGEVTNPRTKDVYSAMIQLR